MAVKHTKDSISTFGISFLNDHVLEILNEISRILEP